VAKLRLCGNCDLIKIETTWHCEQGR